MIEEEFAGVRRSDLSISGWNALTIAQHGSSAQLERFVRPSLLGEIEFCQFFSEPGAGSDAAAVQTRRVKVEGGWRVTGQKVWTSLARLVGPAAAVREGEHKRAATWLMATLGATIGGGTSEILRNQIAERLLDLPRDPLIQ